MHSANRTAERFRPLVFVGSRMDRQLVLAVLVGSALLANPLWLVPHADEPRYVYRASATTASDVHAAESVLACGTNASPTCALERRAVTDGVAVGATPAAFDDRPAFVYLRSRDRYYRTSVRWVDGARTATGTPVAFEAVRDQVARDGPSAFASPAADVVSDALADGSARSRTRVVLDEATPDGPVVVADGDGYVTVRRTGTDQPPPMVAASDPLVRGVLSLFGVTLVAVAGVVGVGRRRRGER